MVVFEVRPLGRICAFLLCAFLLCVCLEHSLSPPGQAGLLHACEGSASLPTASQRASMVREVPMARGAEQGCSQTLMYCSMEDEVTFSVCQRVRLGFRHDFFSKAARSGTGCPGSGAVAIPGGVPEPWRCGTWGAFHFSHTSALRPSCQLDSCPQSLFVWDPRAAGTPAGRASLSGCALEEVSLLSAVVLICTACSVIRGNPLLI